MRFENTCIYSMSLYNIIVCNTCANTCVYVYFFCITTLKVSFKSRSWLKVDLNALTQHLAFKEDERETTKTWRFGKSVSDFSKLQQFCKEDIVLML